MMRLIRKMLRSKESPARSLSGGVDFFVLLALSCTCMLACGQSVGLQAVTETSNAVAGLEADELLALIAVLSLLYALYLSRNMFIQSTRHADEMSKRSNAITELVSELKQRPCIRRPQND